MKTILTVTLLLAIAIAVILALALFNPRIARKREKIDALYQREWIRKICKQNREASRSGKPGPGHSFLRNKGNYVYSLICLSSGPEGTNTYICHSYDKIEQQQVESIRKTIRKDMADEFDFAEEKDQEQINYQEDIAAATRNGILLFRWKSELDEENFVEYILHVSELEYNMNP